MLRVARLFVLGAVMLVFPVALAHAESIPLTGGVIQFDVGVFASAPTDLVGERGFSYRGTPFLGIMPTAEPLPPGTTVAFDAAALGVDVGGVVTLDGRTYENVGGLVSMTGANLRLTASVPLPGELGTTAVVTSPFLLDFEFLDLDRDASYTLVGSGLARFTLVSDASFGVPSWRFERVRAELSSTPIPEPATLLLVGSALGIAVGRSRRAAARSHVITPTGRRGRLN